MKNTERHVPVLLKESIEFLITNPDGTYFDGTLGFGGHSELILSKLGKEASLAGTDKDKIAFDYCLNKFSKDKRVSVFNTSFTSIDVLAKLENIEGFSGIFADLGVSSFQLDDKDEGFTYRHNAPLDLRMNKEKGFTASHLLNSLSEKEIANVLWKYGEEYKARQIARSILKFRKTQKIETTFDLKKIVESEVPVKYQKKSLSRVFQAIRILVNNELEELEHFLEKSIKLLNKGGRIVILTYHSLEDRIVKDFFKHESLTCVCPPDFPVCNCDKEARLIILTKKPVIPSDEEIKNNKRSRSAKLRAAERV